MACTHDAITINPIEDGSGIFVVCARCGKRIVKAADYGVLQGPAAWLAISLWRPDDLSMEAKSWIEDHIVCRRHC